MPITLIQSYYSNTLDLIMEYSNRLTGKEIKSQQPSCKQFQASLPTWEIASEVREEHILLVHPALSLLVRVCQGDANFCHSAVLREILRLETGQQGSTCFRHWEINLRMWRTYPSDAEVTSWYISLPKSCQDHDGSWLLASWIHLLPQ